MTAVQKTEVGDGNKGAHLNVYPVIVFSEFHGHSGTKRDQTTIFRLCHSYVALEYSVDAEPRGDEQIEICFQTS